MILICSEKNLKYSPNNPQIGKIWWKYAFFTSNNLKICILVTIKRLCKIYSISINIKFHTFIVITFTIYTLYHVIICWHLKIITA